uniref:Pickpocket protein 19 n=1 Tax=Drosophila rhopaloa TaxID=1041015 RepID=A0A6P4FNE2_DRORH
MFYPLELPRPRRPLYWNYKGNTGLIQTQQDPINGSRLGKLWCLLLPYLKGYAAESSVHGIRYLADPKMKKFERLIWLLILVTTSIGAIVVYVDLNELYQTVRIQTTIKNTMLPIFRVPFPAIGVCQRNRVNWMLLENGAAEHFLGANVSAAQKDVFIKFFTAAGDPHLSRINEMSNFFSNASLVADLHLLDGLDLREVYMYLQFRCQDLFFSCRWRGNPVNCCEVFEHQFTESGLCFVFNTEISPSSRKRAVITFSIERHPEENDFVNNPFKESMICDCFTSCTQLIFERIYSTTSLDYNETNTETGSMRLEIFYQSGWIIQYQTTMRFTFVELLASFGGIIGLFLGASLLSAIELAYYFSIGLYLYINGKRKLKKPEPRIITVPFGQRKITPIKYTH